MIGAFLDDLRNGNTPSRQHIGGQSLRNYAKSAANVLQNIACPDFTIYDPEQSSAKKPQFVRYLQDRLRTRDRWKPPARATKEPLTYPVFQSLWTLATQSGESSSFLSRESLVYDTACLGCFTGSRVSEYAQSDVPQGQRFVAVPNGPDANGWAGWPVAFVRSDFTFYSKGQCVVNPSNLVQSYQAGELHFLQVRFRFAKAGKRFATRRFAITNDPHLNAVKAAVRILHRADLLHVPFNEPVCAFRPPSGNPSYSFLRSDHITDILRAAVVHAYPDPRHHLRVNIQGIVPHSHRVTAAVCLQLDGQSRDAIAWKLRWTSVDSVPTYLRECFQDVGAQVTSTVTGAWKTSNVPAP